MKKSLKFLSVAILVIAIVGAYRFPQVREATLAGISDISSVVTAFVGVNGQNEWWGTVPMNATSTVLCSITNELAATSSIDYVSAEVTARGGINAANSLVISTSTSLFATSSTNLVHDYAMGTGQFSLVFQKNSATTTGSTAGAPAGVLPGMTTTGASAYVLGPSERIQFVVASTSPGGGGTFASYMTGKCTVKLKKI